MKPLSEIREICHDERQYQAIELAQDVARTYAELFRCAERIKYGSELLDHDLYYGFKDEIITTTLVLIDEGFDFKVFGYFAGSDNYVYFIIELIDTRTNENLYRDVYGYQDNHYDLDV